MRSIVSFYQKEQCCCLGRLEAQQRNMCHPSTFSYILYQETHSFFKQDRHVGRKMEENAFLLSVFSFVLTCLTKRRFVKLSMKASSINNQFLSENFSAFWIDPFEGQVPANTLGIRGAYAQIPVVKKKKKRKQQVGRNSESLKVCLHNCHLVQHPQLFLINSSGRAL